jgi:hypothetical protein
MMRKIVTMALSLVAAFIAVSCEKKVEQPAAELLEKARAEFVDGKYNNARLLIDSIRVVSPKAYKTLREAEQLRRKVLVKEKERDVSFYDETLSSLLEQRDSLSGMITFSKDSRFQDEGVYTVPSQAISLNPYNCFLRASVKENGDTYIASLYRGKRIAHKSVRVSAGDSFVDCSSPLATRSYKELGVYNERLDFKYGADGGIMDFIAASGGPFKVTLEGSGGKYEYTLRHDDVLAISQVLEMSKVLNAISETKAMREEAQRALDFLMKSQERSTAARVKEGVEE